MLGHFRNHIDVNGKKYAIPEGESEELWNGQRTFLVDSAWDWILKNKGIDRMTWNRNRAPMPLHVHAVFANVL